MMEFDMADKLDLEWHGIFHKHLKHFLYQNRSERHPLEHTLKEVFCADPDSEKEVKNEDKEVFEKCLTEALNMLLSRPTVPRQSQIRHLLNIAKYVSKDESCFINLNSNNVFLRIAYLLQLPTEVNTKLLFMQCLHSFLEHPSGVKWLMETKYWSEVFAFTVRYQDLDERVSKIGYEILRILLEKTIDMDKSYCEEIMKVIAGPLINTSRQIKSLVPDNSTAFMGIKPTASCLVEILEGLLKNYSADVLSYIMNLKVGPACDLISGKCSDIAVCLLLDRISIILSFFGLSEIFDGIKSIKQDPLVLSGFISIIDEKIEKDLFPQILELYHYALQYLKYIPDKLPTYHFKDKQINTEAQLVTLQLEPILLEWARLKDATDLLEEADADLEVMSHPLEILKNLSFKTLHVGFKIKHRLPPCSFDIYTKAVENIAKSKDFYSKKSLGVILDSLIYGLEAQLRYLQFQLKNNKKVAIEDNQQMYILALLEASLVFIESFNPNWPDSVKVLDLLYIVIEGVSSYQWIEQIMLKSLILLQEIISRRFSPSMALLIDTADGLKNIGPLLYKTCFTPNWKVRKAVIDVVHTITLSANNCFTSFKTILLGASLPSLISTMALNDEHFMVRATAINCLHQILVMEGIEEILPKTIIVHKILDIIMEDVESEVTLEALKLIKTIYTHEQCLDKDITTKIYKCLEQEGLSNKNTNDDVQTEVVEFCRIIVRTFLNKTGWLDHQFPSVTFSKRIVSLTTEEINKRCNKALSDLSNTGCLNVFKRFWYHFDDRPTDVKKCLLNCLHRFYNVFVTNKITPESMGFNQEFLDFSSIQMDPMATSPESEDVLQDIISETMMGMSVDLELVNNRDPHVQMDSSFVNINGPSTTANVTCDVATKVTPSEFVQMVYGKMSELLENEGSFSLIDDPSKETEVYILDY